MPHGGVVALRDPSVEKPMMGDIYRVGTVAAIRMMVKMPDGVRLAISLWLPDTADPVPVVLEAIPYRKRDSTRGYANSPFFRSAI